MNHIFWTEHNTQPIHGLSACIPSSAGWTETRLQLFDSRRGGCKSSRRERRVSASPGTQVGAALLGPFGARSFGNPQSSRNCHFIMSRSGDNRRGSGSGSVGVKIWSRCLRLLPTPLQPPRPIVFHKDMSLVDGFILLRQWEPEPVKGDRGNRGVGVKFGTGRCQQRRNLMENNMSHQRAGLNI